MRATSNETTATGTPATGTPAPWSVGRWVAVNAIGLGTAFGLFALLGGTVEALGADHDSLIRDLSLLVAFLVGGSLWAYLRQQTLLPDVERAGRVGTAAVIALTAGFVGGFVIGGPPLDFVLSILAVGTVAGGIERRILRRHLPRPGRRSAIAPAGWLAAGIVAIIPAALFGDTIDAALGDLGGFVAILLMIGLVAGAVGGALEALALGNRIDRPPTP
ncbi:hypothetical protein [Nitriliruptor alkaliphilus]|uniref:hypothetical protein n=1 Tax=Nitriliruptor alkaliphilus TaxID=427918 RepID=UPI000698B989|nr:hypothetical protein [Nitriliruptor alkaliphilus]